jgi:hypothetical protein
MEIPLVFISNSIQGPEHKKDKKEMMGMKELNGIKFYIE